MQLSYMALIERWRVVSIEHDWLIVLLFIDIIIVVEIYSLLRWLIWRRILYFDFLKLEYVNSTEIN